MGLRSKSIAQETTPTPPAALNRPNVARAERLAHKGMAVHDAERERYVEDLKRAVWDGSYDPSAEEIADAFLAEREADRLGNI